MRLRALGGGNHQDTLLSSMYLAEKTLTALGFTPEQAATAKERFMRMTAPPGQTVCLWGGSTNADPDITESAQELERLFSEDELGNNVKR